MFDPVVYLATLGSVLAAAALVWLLSVAKRDVSIVDGLWGLLFVIAAAHSAIALGASARATLVLALVCVWALRLSIYITWRNWGAGEDHRYRAIRQRNEPRFWLKSLYLVFGLQAVLAWIISLPLTAAIAMPTPLGWLDALGVAIWLGGWLFESIGDWQLARFKSDPANQGRVLDRGLWRYTRHPNYFGECCLWWGFYLIALGAGAWWSILSPLLMTFLLLRVSGVALLEQTIGERRPAYVDYVRRTSAFLPLPRRKSAVSRAAIDL